MSSGLRTFSVQSGVCRPRCTDSPRSLVVRPSVLPTGCHHRPVQLPHSGEFAAAGCLGQADGC